MLPMCIMIVPLWYSFYTKTLRIYLSLAIYKQENERYNRCMTYLGNRMTLNKNENLNLIKKISESPTMVFYGEDENSLKEYRKTIASIQKNFKEMMKTTASKNIDEILSKYNSGEINEYIKHIIDSAYKGEYTSVSYQNYRYQEIQNLRIFEENIVEIVNRSEFTSKKFKFKHLDGLVSIILRSKTIHELRQNTKLIIEPLKFAIESQDSKETDKDLINYLTLEVDRLDKLADYRLNVINSIAGELETNPFRSTKEEQDKELLNQIEGTKKSMNLTDIEVCKMFDTSRSSLNRLRNKYK